MAITIQPPLPGSLITSNFMTQLIDELVSLDKRIAALEIPVPGSDGKVAIDQISPTDVVIGDQIQIAGLNFGLPAENVISFDGGNSVTQFFAGSNDRLLILTVPQINIGNLASKLVTVTVANPRGSASKTINVQSIQPTIPGGSIGVSPGLIPGNITSGADWVFSFNIAAKTNMDEIYDLVPTLPSSSPAWRAAIVSNANGTTELPQPWRITIPKPVPGQSSNSTIFVKVSIPQGNVVTSPFVKLDVISTRNPTGPTALIGSFTSPFQFSQPQQAPQTVKFVINSFTGNNVGGDINSVSMPVPTPKTPPINGINYSFQDLKAATNYTLSLAWKDTSNNSRGWTASFGGAPGLPNWPTTSKTIPMVAAGDDPEKVAIVGETGASENTLIITVRSVSDSNNDYGILEQIVKPGQ